MTRFPQNLSILRRRAGLTQEGLAEQLEVSRQAVGKWESGQTMPEADKLITLAEVLGCSLDDLLRNELNEADAPPPLPEVYDPAGDRAHFAAWSAHYDRFSLAMAGGVALILVGVALTLACWCLGFSNAFLAVPMLLCIGAAVFVFIIFGMEHEDFTKTAPAPPDLFSPEEKERFRRTFRMGMATAVAAILGGVVLIIFTSVLWVGQPTRQVWGVVGFFGVLAAAVFAMVYLGVQSEKYDDAGERETEKRDVSGIIMLSATAIFLAAGFLFNKWHPAWVVFPIGGILCAIVDELKKKK